jgi:hypothetical protein
VGRFVVLVARLKPDSRERAQELLAEYSAVEILEGLEGVERNAIFLSETEVIFLFEGEGSAESLRAKFNDPVLSTAISHWLPLFDGPLHNAAEAYFWERKGAS